MIRRYIERFENIVDLLRVTGTYTATLSSGTLYNVVSSVEHYLTVNDYVTLDAMPMRVTAVASLFAFQVDALGQVVTLSGTWKAMAPYSIYGTRKTVNQMMLERNGYEFKYQKYPLIALRLPSPVVVKNTIHTVSMNILIATFTNKQYTPAQRIAATFNPILYPLANRFLRMLRKSGDFTGFNREELRQIDRMFYGSESGDEQNIKNIFSDPLDAIELAELKVSYMIDDCDDLIPRSSGDGGFENIFEEAF